MLSELPICLKRKQPKPHPSLHHVKSKPQVLYKYKVNRPSKELSLTWEHSSQKVVGFNLDSMPKTLRAYYSASKKRNAIKPDRLASQQAEAPPPPPVEKESAPEPKIPEKVDDDYVYCVCKRPYTTGHLMFKCEGFCGNWYHPACLKMQQAEVERQQNSNERWYCPSCNLTAEQIVNECGGKRRRGNSNLK